VFGEEFEPEAFLAGSELKADAVFKKGEPVGRRPGKGKRAQSGLNIGVSDAEWDELGGQIADATAFLTKHRAELEQLHALLGDGGLTLDFALDSEIGRSKWTQSGRFPAAFVRLAGEIGVEIELSFYPADDGEPDSEDGAPRQQ
jgi:hypothetical protein